MWLVSLISDTYIKASLSFEVGCFESTSKPWTLALSTHFLALILSLGIIKFTVYSIKIMRLPVFLSNRMVSLLLLPLKFLLVILFVNIDDDVELFVIVEYFCLFDGQSNLTFLEVEIGEFLVAYHVVYVTHWT